MFDGIGADGISGTAARISSGSKSGSGSPIDHVAGFGASCIPITADSAGFLSFGAFLVGA